MRTLSPTLESGYTSPPNTPDSQFTDFLPFLFFLVTDIEGIALIRTACLARKRNLTRTVASPPLHTSVWQGAPYLQEKHTENKTSYHTPMLHLASCNFDLPQFPSIMC